MAKAELQAEQDRYDRDMALAKKAIADGRHMDGIEHAMGAWEHVEDMMKFERRWEDAEFKSVPCIDLVLKYAPLVMDTASLDKLGELLKSKKGIDRHASDDLATRLNDAREQLRMAHGMWDILERRSSIAADAILDEVGGDKKLMCTILTRWEEMGLVRPRTDRATADLEFVTNLDRRYRAKCSLCGVVVQAPQRSLLANRTCPKCEAESDFVLLGEATSEDAQ